MIAEPSERRPEKSSPRWKAAGGPVGSSPDGEHTMRVMSRASAFSSRTTFSDFSSLLKIFPRSRCSAS